MGSRENQNNKFLKYKAKYYSKLIDLIDKLNYQLKIEHENEEQEEISLKENTTNNNEPCIICKTDISKYKCPKCKINYCSVKCYKEHNSQCSESFYKNQVISELKSLKEDEESSRQFRYKLKSIYNHINETNGDIFDIDSLKENLESKRIEHYENLLDKMNKGIFNIEKDLTPNDWKEFQRFLISGENNVGKLGYIYKPFWLRDPPSLKIIDLTFLKSLSKDDIETIKNLNINVCKYYYKENNEQNNDEEDIEIDDDESDDDEENFYEGEFNKPYLQIGNTNKKLNYEIINISLYLKWQEVKNISELCSIKPHVDNVYQIVMIVAIISYIFRKYNGDFTLENIIDVFQTIFTMCPLLYEKVETIPNNFRLTISYIIEHLNNSLENQNLQRIKQIMARDIYDIINGKNAFMFECLIRLYEIIHLFQEMKGKKRELKLKANHIKQKLIFLMSYLKSEMNENRIDLLLDEIKEYICI